MYLEQIKKANDIKSISEGELNYLASEIRRFLVNSLSKTGGHLASNLGVVELTIALHYVLNFPEDKLIFDVGHQAYVHKILTGRMNRFDSLRKTGGLCGFPDPNEDETDLFKGGHASTAIGEGVGLAEAAGIRGSSEKIVTLVGDGALTGGISFEAINNASKLKRNLTIVLNDNNMSITKSVGGVSSNISAFRTSRAYADVKKRVIDLLEQVPYVGDTIADTVRLAKDEIKRLLISDMFFEDMGIMYLGPVNGHDIPSLIKMLNLAMQVQGPVVVHAITKKGKGYRPAAGNPSKYHGVSPFDVKTGELKKKKKPDYTDVLSKTMKEMAKGDKSVCAVTAAMANGSGVASFAKRYPDRFFDAGIAEEYAVVLAAALSKGGMMPIVSIYSTFLQRSFDQILMEVCLNELPMVFALDRAGIVGSDGATHQGVFDIAYLSMMPGMVLMAPKNGPELSAMLKTAVKINSPTAIRYPRGTAWDGLHDRLDPVVLGKCEPLYSGSDVHIFALGSMVKIACEVREILSESGISVAVTNARFAKPIDSEYLSNIKEPLLVTMEEGCLLGGFGMHVNTVLKDTSYSGKIINIGIEDKFMPHGDVSDIMKMAGLDADTVSERIREALL